MGVYCSQVFQVSGECIGRYYFYYLYFWLKYSCIYIIIWYNLVTGRFWKGFTINIISINKVNKWWIWNVILTGCFCTFSSLWTHSACTKSVKTFPAYIFYSSFLDVLKQPSPLHNKFLTFISNISTPRSKTISVIGKIYCTHCLPSVRKQSINVLCIWSWVYRTIRE